VEADGARIGAIAAPVSTWVNSAAFASWMTPLTAPGGLLEKSAELARVHEQSVGALSAELGGQRSSRSQRGRSGSS
jgi:hypothetical protein